MAEGNGTRTTEQDKGPTRRMRIPRVVVVVLLASLIVSGIAVFFSGGDLASLIASAFAVLYGRAVLSEIFAGGIYPAVFAGDIYNRAILWGTRTVAVLVIIGASWRLIRKGYNYQWTGLGEAELPKPKQENVELRPRKTLWDWLQLLIVPLAVAGVGFWFTMQQDARQQTIQQQNAQAEALQAYLDEMGNLLLEKKLRKSEEDSEVRTLARARTLTVLGRLDSSRKAAVMQFLDEAQLIQRVEGREPIIGLGGANLDGTNLNGADLRGAHLRTADLSGASLYRTDLSNARLSYAHLRSASLYRTDLSNADLGHADLSGAYLQVSNLRHANLFLADLSDAYLLVVDLRYANLRYADLRNVRRMAANLNGARLYLVDISQADLSEANGVTKEQLEEQARDLEGAIMPDGSRHP